MEIKGKIIQVLPLQTGEGKNGTWKRQDFILETADSQYPKKVCIAAWGDKFDQSAIQSGNDVNVFFDVESREYNSKWYTDVKAWKIESLGSGGGNSEAVVAPKATTSVPAFTPVSPELAGGGGDDLPF